MVFEQHKEGSLYQVLPRSKSIFKYRSEVEPIANQYSITLADLTTGVGKYKWKVDGDGWQKITAAPADEYDLVAYNYCTQQEKVKEALKDRSYKDDIFTVPDTSFIYYRLKPDGNYEYAVTAWGFRDPYKAPIRGAHYDITKINKEAVNIAFVWDGKRVPNVDFWFNNVPKKTGKDGFFHVGDKLQVGNRYLVVTPDKLEETLIVEQGKTEYIYDITQYFTVGVQVSFDGSPVGNQQCDLMYYKGVEQLTTDESGRATIKLPCSLDVATATPKDPQPAVKVTCRSEQQQQVPAATNGAQLLFEFQFKTPEHPKTKSVNGEIHVVKNGSPLAGEQCLLSFNGEDRVLTTDANGVATAQFAPFELQGNLMDMPEMTAEYNGRSQSLKPTFNEAAETLVFTFEETTQEALDKQKEKGDPLPPPEPPAQKMVTFTVLDYGEYPMPDLDIVLITKQKGEIPLKTDANGRCQIPKDWLLHGEKLNVKFTVSDEYQQQHDIHNGKKKQ